MDGWRVVVVEGDERAHLIPENDDSEHRMAPDCECGVIKAEEMPGHHPVWVHGFPR